MMTLVGIVRTEEIVRKYVEQWVDSVVRDVTDPRRRKFGSVVTRCLEYEKIKVKIKKDSPELSEEVVKEFVDELTRFWLNKLEF